MNALKLTVKAMPMALLKAHPQNPRLHPEPGSAEWATLRKSLEHDYFDPVVWNKRNGFLVSGHLRAKVMDDMGVETVDVVVVDYDEPTHEARMIAANRQTGGWEDITLASLLETCKAPELAGFTDDQLKSLMASVGPVDMDAPEKGSPDKKDAPKWNCPKCGFVFSA